MTIILVFILSVIVLSFWWLLRQGILSKPWLETGPVGAAAIAPHRPPDARAGLRIFLFVVGSLFALLGSAFVMRLDLETWSSLALPKAVWINTLLLVAASALFHRSHRAATRGDVRQARQALAGAALLTLAFLIGQLLLWQALQDQGDGLTSGPAASFFFLLSGLHGLHILGGIVTLAVVTARAGDSPDRLRIETGLCATYWDFLLVIWVGLLLLFMGWANQLIDICRSVLT